MKVKDPIVGNIRIEMFKRGINASEMAEQMGISLATFYKRMDDPDSLRIGDLKMAARFLHKDVTDLLRRPT